MPHDHWVLQLQALHFHARCTDTFTHCAFPIWSHPLHLAGPSLSTHSRWRLHFGWIDLTLSRDLQGIIPLFGIKFAAVRHKSRIVHCCDTFSNELSMKNKFFGLGPEFGLLLLWPWEKHLHLFAKGATSFLIGEFYLHQDEDSTQIPDRLKLLSSFYLPRELLEGALGISYCHCTGSITWALKASFEISLLTGQNLAIQFPNAHAPGHLLSNLGDLSLHGWALGLSCHF